MFLFVVRRLRWLARVPLLPPLFDALLLGWTSIAHRARLAAMDDLEARVLTLPRVGLRVHRLGGLEFVRDGCELGHVHSNGLLDARLPRDLAESLIAAGAVRAHHVFPPRSGWISFQLETRADVPRALEILAHGPRKSGGER